MGRAYSLDLRRKVLRAYLNKEGSLREIASRFCVSLSFVQSLIKRYRTTNHIDPFVHGGGRKCKLSSQQLINIQRFIARNPDLSLTEIKRELESQDITISVSTVQRIKTKKYPKP